MPKSNLRAYIIPFCTLDYRATAIWRPRPYGAFILAKTGMEYYRIARLSQAMEAAAQKVQEEVTAGVRSSISSI